MDLLVWMVRPRPMKIRIVVRVPRVLSRKVRLRQRHVRVHHLVRPAVPEATVQIQAVPMAAAAPLLSSPPAVLLPIVSCPMSPTTVLKEQLTAVAMSLRVRSAIP